MQIKRLFFHLGAAAGCLFISTAVFGQGSPNVLWIGHQDLDRINTVIFDPTGEILISGSSDRLIHFWRVSDGALLRTLNTNAPFVHESAIEWLAINHNSTQLASVSYQTVRLWALPSGTHRDFVGHTDWVVGTAFSPDGQWVATASFDKTVRVWRVSDGATVRTLTNDRQMRCVAFSPDGTLLAGAGGDTFIHLWRTSDWTEVRTLTGHTSDIYVIAFSPDGTKLASGGYDRTAKIWNVTTGTNLHTFGTNNGNIYGLAFTPDNTQLAYSDGEGSTIRLHRVSDGARVRLYNQQVDQVQTLAFSQTGLLGYGRVDERVFLARIDGTNPPPASGWTLTAVGHGGGTIQINPSPNGATGLYPTGAVVQLTATPIGTNRFLGWSGSTSSASATISFKMNTNMTITANFTGEPPLKEIVWQHSDQRLAAWYMDGPDFKRALLLNNGRPLVSGWRLLAHADLNRDGKDDFIFQHSDGRTAAWLMNGDTRIAAFLLRGGRPVASGWRIAGAADFTSDGKNDILFSRDDGRLALWIMNGTNFSSAVQLNNGIAVNPAWRIVAVPDFNLDDKPDILWFNTMTGTTMIWLMNGTSMISSTAVRGSTGNSAGWTAVGAGDFNNDQQIDILWHHTSGQLSAWLLNRGTYTASILLRNGQCAAPAWDVVGVR